MRSRQMPFATPRKAASTFRADWSIAARAGRASLLPLVIAIAGCMPVAPKPRSVGRPPVPSPPAVPILAPAPTDWRDLPETAGTWHYGREATGSTASFGQPGAPPQFTVRCRTSERRVQLIRAGAQAGPLTIRTSYAPMSWPAAVGPDGAAVTLAAADPFLDRLAFSRGRFTVQAAAAPELVLPAWAEPARVIEDCRG